ncbi:winged helix-turn-helix domain-containing protein [Pseudoxanthomonas helianthi]|uniref:Winged helix-turn-helix domain-containing protein n=1 Tax=Pseudoxanthomonas helianthi TaxID=1453541 RepID=A0A941AVT3_9GAMM|nr:transcriptional regulator [Pseudoxanthomonas helianthi]MBP3985292.1 winged helix-turn-helix domain-containing protein [Pseudoxanthomonas helianthi]
MRLKYLFGEFELNPASRELLRNGKPVALRARSLECLVYLIEHRDRAVGRDELISAVWGRVDASGTVVAQTLLRARKALDDTGNQQAMIRTLPRFGYRWVMPVQEVALSSEADGADGTNGPNGEAVAEAAAPPDTEPVVPADAWEEVEVEAPAKELEKEQAGHDTSVSSDIGAAGAPPSAHRWHRRFPRAGWTMLAMLIVVAGLGFYYLRYGNKDVSVAANDAVLVMPVAVVPMDSENAWVRLGAMDYMAARLRGSGINVLPSEQALRLSAAVEGDMPALARKKLLALSGARWVVQPEMEREQAGWRVRLRLFDAGKEQRIEARAGTVLAAVAEAADAWLRQSGGNGAGPPPSPLAERLHRIDAEILVGRLVEARRLVRSASPAERGDPRFLLREARLEFRAANLDASGRLFRDALDHAPKADPDTKISALIGLGTVERSRNNLDAAEQRFTQSLALLESLPPDRVNSRMVGLTYQGRGIIRAQHGDVDAGVKDMGQARVWLQRSGDLIALGVIGHNIGKAETLRGDYLQALHEFDRSIETFERFRVNDYLATTLQEKADVQMVLARPVDAWNTIRRAEAQLPKLENGDVAAGVLATKARIQIALGRLRDAGVTLAGLRSRGLPETDPRLLELWLRLYLARGEFVEARRLAASGPPAAGASGGLVLAAIQAALRGRDVPLARTWLASIAPSDEREDDHAIALGLARSLIDRAAGERAAALQQAEKVAASGGSRAAPEMEVRTGVVQAMLLLDTRQYASASAIMGELEKYAETDYRVAWVMWALYRALGDPHAAASAGERTKTLGGERDTAVEPIL